MMIILLGGKARSGKDTTASFMKELIESKTNKKVFIKPLSGGLKAHVDTYGLSREEAREKWIEAGAYGRTKISEDIFIVFLKAQIMGALFEGRENLNWDNTVFIIPDVRYPNELASLKLFPFVKTFYIESHLDNIKKRFDNEEELKHYLEYTRNHDSENRLSGKDFEDIIYNNGTLEDLKKALLKITDDFF